MENKIEKEYSIKEFCTLIAWLINCDNKAFNFNDKVYTAENCFNYNSHGELGGLIIAANNLKPILKNEDNKFDQDVVDRCLRVLNGEEILVELKYGTGLGMMCIANMWQVGKDFIDATYTYMGALVLKHENLITP